MTPAPGHQRPPQADIRIDHRTRIGSGPCTLTAPAVFTQDDDGYA